MPRRAKPTKPEAGAKPPVARKSVKGEDARVRDLEQRLAEALKGEAQALKLESEAREQQRAAGEILKVMSGSPAAVQPVFAAIAESARRLCGGDFCNVARYDDGLIHLAASAHTRPEAIDFMRRLFPMTPTRATTFGRTILERAVVYIQDATEDPEYFVALAEVNLSRSAVGVPM